MATSTSSATSSLTGLGLSGLSSGLDTSGIITKLMAIEAAPQTALKSQLSTATSYRTALQSLNSSVAAVTTSAKSAAAKGALASFTTSSSSVAATAKTTTGASAGSVSFTVGQTAKAQVSVSPAMSSWDTTNYGTFTIRRGGDATTDTVVKPSSSNLDDVVAAINASTSGVTASKVAAATVNGTTQYRLQLTSSTGSANAFTISAGSPYGSDASNALGLTQVSAAQNASVTLYSGTAASETVSSASNTFTNLVTGLDVTVSGVSTDPVTVTVASDSTAATTAAQSLTASLMSLFSGIDASTAVTTSSSGSASSASGGVFTGDPLVRALKDSLLNAATGAVGGKSPSSIGITLTKTGSITFDQTKFAAAMANDPSGTAAMFQTIADRVTKAGDAVSNSYDGSLTKSIASKQSNESDLTDEINTWDLRLAKIQAQYTLQFNNLETALNSLSSQSSYLTSQITGLTTNYQK